MLDHPLKLSITLFLILNMIHVQIANVIPNNAVSILFHFLSKVYFASLSILNYLVHFSSMVSLCVPYYLILIVIVDSLSYLLSLLPFPDLGLPPFFLSCQFPPTKEYLSQQFRSLIKL